MAMSMQTLDLFPPLPTMMQGSESIALDSTARLRALRRELVETRPKPAKIKAKTSSLHGLTIKKAVAKKKKKKAKTKI